MTDNRDQITEIGIRYEIKKSGAAGSIDFRHSSSAKLWVAGRVESYGLRVMGCALRGAGCALRVAGCEKKGKGHGLMKKKVRRWEVGKHRR